jgi:class 3 adenylate cyclase/tetratricopeptide (TPR) repeat protein
MRFSEIVAQASTLLQRKGRITYRALQREFDLDETALVDLKDELIEGERVAHDENGKVLVWTGTHTEQPADHEEQRKGEAPTPPPAAPSAAEAERRQLTVMFCDLVGSTPLAEKLDPEELRQVILAYQQTCADQIRRFEGYLARYVGDGLLVYFGYPQAHEDDAQRAIRVGLGIVAALPTLNHQLQQTVQALGDFPLQVRTGIHTGLVVVGDMGGGGYRDPRAIVGETPNIAARLQGLAEPDTVVISEATHRLVQGLFVCQDYGPQALKGVSAPVRVYRVLSESRAQSRFEVALRTGLTPLVGRDLELSLLQERWAQAKGGEGHVVLLSGEPGIGKSRLVQELKEQVSAQGATCIRFRCSPYHQQSAFYPITEHLQRLLQFAPHDLSQVKLAKLQQALTQYRFPQAETLPLLATLLSVPQPEGTPPLTLSPQKQRQKTQEALVAWLVEETERDTVYCVWEDLHWADPSTLEFLTLFLDQVPTSRLLAVLTFRPDFTPPWGSRSYLSQLMLNRLGRSQVEVMVEKVTRGKTLPLEVMQQIVAKTDGVPLFVEELTKMVLESGLLTETDGHYALTGPLAPLAIPTTLHDSLMARLDRLSTAREVAQLGATLGREFPYELLRAVSPLEEISLQQALGKLVEAEVLYQSGVPPQARYLFKHALIQEAAYQSLLKSTRQQYHRQIAQMLAGQFPDIKEAQPELLAHHYTEAGFTTQAVPYWRRAGQRATQRSAHLEAISHLTKGLELVKTLPATAEHTEQELRLLITLGSVRGATHGWAAPDTEWAYARARELCHQVGETPQLFPVLGGLCAFYQERMEFRTAHELGEQMLRLAQSLQAPIPLLWAHLALGQTLAFLGKFAPAREHLEQSLTLYDSTLRRSYGFVYDPGVSGLSELARVLWFLGYSDQAKQRSHEALTLASELSHPFSLALSATHAAEVHRLRGEQQADRALHETKIAVCTEQGFALGLAAGRMWQGWALAEQGHGESGIAQIHQGLAALRAAGSELGRLFGLMLLAEAYGKEGRIEAGLSALAEALALVDKSEERIVEAELYRLQGGLMLKSQGQGPQSQVEHAAEACFLKAIEIARLQQAKSWELRAVISLSRLWQQQGKKAEARQLLAEIYNWFTEGFDTKDLQEAKALLEELH